jgi:hypothetical protein
MKTLILLFSVLFTTMSFAQVPNYVPANGLVGWWPFNGNANDESGNGNNGTVNGATLTTDRNGVANQAYSFDGVNDYINVINPTILNFNIGISFTVSFFYNAGNIVTNSSGFNGIIARQWQFNNNGSINGWQIGRDINNYRLEGPGIDGCVTNTLSSVDFNQWVNIVQVYDRVNGIVTTYKNSSLVNQIYCTQILSSMSNNYDLKFGVERENSQYSSGKIDDIGIWNRALTECEIQNLYTSTNPTNTTTATACDSYVWNGTTYTQSGVYTGTTANCVTQSLDLTITPSSTNTTAAAACNSYTWNGTTYTQSGVYTGPTANCVTESLDLTITPSSTNTSTASACDSYTWNGTNYSASGVYTGSTANCVTESLNLTITQTFSDTTIAIACDSYTWNGQTYTESGTYTGITENCITQSLKLTINPSTSSSISQTALDSYTWPVNNQTYTTTGAYTAVIPNTSGCDSTITLNLTMSFTGINDLSASKLSIYPNPTNGDFTITGLELLGTVSSLSLTDMNGKVVKVLDTKATKFSMASIKPGVYFLNIISGNKQEVLKIVKE